MGENYDFSSDYEWDRYCEQLDIQTELQKYIIPSADDNTIIYY